MQSTTPLLARRGQGKRTDSEGKGRLQKSAQDYSEQHLGAWLKSKGTPNPRHVHVPQEQTKQLESLPICFLQH